jgi:hypothetical protein
MLEHCHIFGLHAYVYIVILFSIPINYFFLCVYVRTSLMEFVELFFFLAHQIKPLEYQSEDDVSHSIPVALDFFSLGMSSKWRI